MVSLDARGAHVLRSLATIRRRQRARPGKAGMTVEATPTGATMEGILPVDGFGLRELEEIRLILRGASVVDWRRLNFRTREEVDDYLRLCLFRPDHPSDQERLRAILAESVA